MNRTKTGRFGVLFLALIILLGLVPISANAAAASWIDITDKVSESAVVIATDIGYKTYGIWHYSGGYWAQTESSPLRIYDKQITGDLESLADMLNYMIEFNFDLPQAVSASLSAGKKVGVNVSWPAGYDYFNTAKGKPQTKIEGGKLFFQAYPKFNLVPSYRGNYTDFVDGLNKYIPFVDPKYGSNMYSIFTTGGRHLGSANGYFDPSNPMKFGAVGTIHPSQIRSSSGTLTSGSTVTVWNNGATDYDSGDVKIGHGTFQNAGAVSLYFNYGITITYYEIEDNDVAVTSITPTQFPASQSVNAVVTVKNNGSKSVTTPVAFSISGITNERKDVTLAPNESKALTYTFISPASGTFPMTAEINPDRTFTESDYTNNKLTVTGQVQSNDDVAVTKIEKTSYPATSVVVADVTVKNLGITSITTPVEFSIPGITTQTKSITLATGASAVLNFTFSTPTSGTLTMTAEANKDRSFTESNYANNKLTVTATIVPAPIGSTSCSDTITWNESGSHTVRSSYWNGERWVSYSYTCYHTFTYETKLTATYDITPKTLKSGYGFTVTVNNTISTRMVSNLGCGSWGSGRANTKIPATPDKSQVKLGWTVKNSRGTQPSTVDLNLISRIATQSKFEPKLNPISEVGAKLIYTDVALAGTKTSPKTHQIIISITGGGVNGVAFCKGFTDRITINGNMYEDARLVPEQSA